MKRLRQWTEIDGSASLTLLPHIVMDTLHDTQNDDDDNDDNYGCTELEWLELKDHLSQNFIIFTVKIDQLIQ